jgi:hypothetical protein
VSWIFTTLTLTVSCNGLTKNLKPPNIMNRSYRFCSNKEVKSPYGKICYRYCKRKTIVLKKCKETELIIEDLSNSTVYNKFIDAGFIIKIRKGVLKKY